MCNVSVSLCSMRFQTLIHWYIVCADDTVYQVVAVLLPTLKEIQGNINSVRNVIVNNLTEKVSKLEEHQNHLYSKMDQFESIFKAVESQLEEQKTQMTSELAGL